MALLCVLATGRLMTSRPSVVITNLGEISEHLGARSRGHALANFGHCTDLSNDRRKPQLHLRSMPPNFQVSESRCSRSDPQSLWITTTLYPSNCGPPINIGGPVLAFSATELVLLPEGGRRTSVMQSGQQAGALAGPQPLLALLERRPSPASCLHQSVSAPS